MLTSMPLHGQNARAGMFVPLWNLSLILNLIPKLIIFKTETPINCLDRMELESGNYSRFAELPLKEFEELNAMVAVLDFNWNYLFLNRAGYQYVNVSENLIGENVWDSFPMLKINPDVLIIRKNMEKRKSINSIIASPFTPGRMTVSGYALEDCYFFSVSVLPNKEELLHDLRQHL